MDTFPAARAMTSLPSTYTEEERAACLAVRAGLIQDKGYEPEQVSEVELIVITLLAKLRVEEAVRKFCTYHDNLVKEFGIDSVWANRESLSAGDHWQTLKSAGIDEAGRGIMWVNGGTKIKVEDDRPTIHCCCLYFLAVHSDIFTLRNGCSLVINTASAVGNEKKMQVAWQNFPTRPQGIYILGTSAITRVTINTLIAVASLVAKNKVIARIRFSNIDELEDKFGKSNLPEMHGGDSDRRRSSGCRSA